MCQDRHLLFAGAAPDLIDGFGPVIAGNIIQGVRPLMCVEQGTCPPVENSDSAAQPVPGKSRLV